MRKRFAGIFTIVVALLLVCDFYVFFTLKEKFDLSAIFFISVYWAFTIFFLVYLLFVLINKFWKSEKPNDQKKIYDLMGIMILFFFPKILASVFFLLNDVVLLLTTLANVTFTFKFLFWIGIVIGGIVFLLVFYGIAFGKFHFKLDRLDLKFPEFPSSWNGLKIIHISDLHIGSWTGNSSKLEEVVNIINSRDPDLIIFTGDLINNLAEEIEDFKPILKKLKAKKGKFSILGNHDYGDYFPWPTDQAKKENLRRTKNTHHELGFRLLLNDSEALYNGKNTLGIIGVENWGLPPFHQNGDLQKAIHSLNEETDFNILLSHDPSHWKQEIINRDELSLTLSGHTHGMQFGIYTKKLKWSPAQMKYPEWGGLYNSGKQKLYVSTGLGFIGFPGRIGIRPRITEINLYQA